MRKFFTLLLLLISFCLKAQDVSKGTLYGNVIDKDDKTNVLIGAIIRLKGTQLATAVDIDGTFQLKNIHPGTYSVEITYTGYSTVLYTGIKISAGEKKQLNVILAPSVLEKETVTVIGERLLIDVDKADNTRTIDKERIQAAPARQVQEILNTIAGVTNSPTGLHIRGSRTYETGFYIDDVSARDPLAGTGFGVDLGSNAISDIDVTTSGAGVEYGNNTAGVINVKTSTGGDRWTGNVTYKRDNFGNKNWKSVWNQQVMEANAGGTIVPKKLTMFTSLRSNLSDVYLKNPPNQLVSSLFPNSNNLWTPRADSRWSGLVKFNYTIKPTMNLSASYTKSITANQDVNMLRIFGNDASYRPGYQFLYRDQPDNATTYTNDLNLTTLTLNHLVSKRFGYKLIGSRLFVHLRADANGRPWRPENVNTEFDPRSIVTFPVSYYNPKDSVAFVNSPSGLYNNNGISTLWHDHVAEEYTLQYRGYYTSKNGNNKLSFGTEYKHQFLQWIDITRPWVGAPIQLPNGGKTQTFRLGESSDIWKVEPNSGAFFVSNSVKYLGLVADIGARYEYWAPGKYVDDAIDNPRAPIRNEIRQQYKNSTTQIFGTRVKTRLLPRISASFPIKENQVMYFNYRQSMVLPHPSYVYAGLDPYYQDRSTLATVGNPNLNPEVDITYELGLKSQITKDDALGVAAYWKDKYDFITSTTIDIKDATGRDVTRTIRINSDYARQRGIELTYLKRIKKWYSGQISASYSVSTGQSSSASEAIRDIIATGNREDTREYFLPWDVPFDVKFNSIFTLNKDSGLLGKKWLNKMRVYVEGTFRSGRRYTPYILTGKEPNSGRPIYEIDNSPSAKYSKIGTSWLNFDLTYNKWWNLSKHTKLSLILEVTNIFNILNSQTINPITGRAYQYGDAVASNLRDPLYSDPRDPRSRLDPPNDPSRYLAGRHYLVGVSIGF